MSGRLTPAARTRISISPGPGIGTSRFSGFRTSGPPGSVKVVEFVLFGQEFMAITAGPLDPFNHAVSFVVNCDDQAEVDRYWNALLDGGSAEQCGWLKDRYGLSWQIVPTVLGELMTGGDPARAKRVTEAMLKSRAVSRQGPRSRAMTSSPSSASSLAMIDPAHPSPITNTSVAGSIFVN